MFRFSIHEFYERLSILRDSFVIFKWNINILETTSYVTNKYFLEISYLSSCAGTTCHARRAFFVPKLQYL